MLIIGTILAYIILGLYIYTIIVVISVVLLENRNPVKTLSWIIVLISVPVLGLIFYILFGEDFRKQKIIGKQHIKTINNNIFSVSLNQIQKMDLPENLLKTINLLYNNNQSNTYVDNKLDVFSTGQSAFEAIMDDLEKAKEHIHIEFYIIEDDQIGNQLREMLIKKAKEKVRVRVIYDFFGGYKLSANYLNSLRDAGVYIQAFLPMHGIRTINKMNYRNHRKVIVIDGKIAYTGGMNIADRYVYGNKLGLWRDTFLRIQGAAVLGIQSNFLIDWSFVAKKDITNLKYYPKPETYNKNIVQISASGPDTDWKNIMQGVLSVINGAQDHIYIQTPYFAPPESIFTALQNAALSGVDVKIMIPERSDARIVAAASRSYIEDLLEAGVHVLFYQYNFLHSKAIVCDGCISIVGTANMDVRSYEQDFEIAAFIYEEKLARQLEEFFIKDMRTCRELNLNVWKSRKRRERMKESIARLASPLM